MSISPIGAPFGANAVQSLQFSQLKLPEQNASTDFASAISKAAIETMNTIKAGESISMDGLAGRAGLQDVVEGVMAAERSFSTALAVRDKIVGAYLELSRMTV
jgi:flagellar hook-basal body complex protein FliE